MHSKHNSGALVILDLRFFGSSSWELLQVFHVVRKQQICFDPPWLFLSALDRTITASFRSDIDLYMRYIDDVLILARTNEVARLLTAFNGFDPRIRVTHDSVESVDNRYTSFLDLRIQLSSGHIEYSTYRKPMCMYSYLPATSCHSKATKLAIVHTEVVRFMRTNLFEADFNRDKQFLLCKLRDRGYDLEQIRTVADKYHWSCKQQVLAKKDKKLQRRIVPFRIIFSDCANKLQLSYVFKRFQQFPTQRICRCA